MLGLKAYDTALPQPWVDDMREHHGFDVRGHFVWNYDGSSTFGRPFPLTAEGEELMKVVDAANQTDDKCEECGQTPANIGCPDGAQICQRCFDAGYH